MRELLFISLLLFFSSCASRRVSVPEGHVPTQNEVQQEDEQYGHQVFQQLAQKYQLDRNDERILRVRNIVDRLTQVRDNNKNIWHVYIFEDDNFKNAAATRGNFIFIWSGMVNSVESDDELATILAHEIGHVIAGHTQPDPGEAVNEMLASVTGSTTRQVLRTAGSTVVNGLASLGGLLATEIIRALVVNPDKQNLELEADQIGLYIMAEAGYDPRKAITFWERVKDDPNFRGAPVEFLSTHPSSEARLEKLRESLPQALARYNGEPTDSFVLPDDKVKDNSNSPSDKTEHKTEQWEVMDSDTGVFSEPSRSLTPIQYLQIGDRVTIDYREGRWLRITTPIEGYVESYRLSPIE